MSALEAAATFLFLTLMVGLIRIMRGPTPPDRMLGAQLLGTNGVGIIVLLGIDRGEETLFDMALVFSMLAAVAAVAFVQRAWSPTRSREEEDDAPAG